MSIEHVARALQLQGLTPAEKLCFVGMANHDGDGGCWPSVATLATYVGVTPRQVQRLIRSLEEKGRVRVEQNAGGTTRTADHRRPNLYVLSYGVTPMSPGDTDVTGTPDTGVTPPPDTHVTRTFLENHPDEPSASPGGERPRSLDEQNFEEFWKMYPRKVGKPAARRALTAACKKEAPAAIATALQRWIESWKASGTEEQFIPHPATWLNQERWNDAPPPLAHPELEIIDRMLLEATEFFRGRDLLAFRHENIQAIRATLRTLHSWGYGWGEGMIRLAIAARHPQDMTKPSKLANLPRVDRFETIPPDLSRAMETAYRNLRWSAR